MDFQALKLCYLIYLSFLIKKVKLSSEENFESCGCSGTSRGTISQENNDACPADESTCSKEGKDSVEKYTDKENLKVSFIKGGEFQMGTDKPIFVADGEGPSRSVFVDDFYLDIHEVSNQDFNYFVKSTGHVTEVCWTESKLNFKLLINVFFVICSVDLYVENNSIFKFCGCIV